MFHLYLKFSCQIFFILFSLISCGQSPRETQLTDPASKLRDQTIQGSFIEQSDLVFDSTQIAIFFNRYPKIQGYEGDVRRFYRNRNFSYAWFNKGLLIEQAGNLASRILNLEDDGIYKPLFYQNSLDSLMYGTNARDGKKKLDITLELLLTAEYFVFSKLAWEGMNNTVSKSNKWYLPRKTISYDKYLDSLLKTPSERSGGEEPVYRQYELLRTYLKKYTALALEEWEPIVNHKKALSLGDTSSIITQIKIRLFKFEDYLGDTSSNVFGMDLALSVKQFQTRHGLKPDGLITKETVAELNIPIKNRIKKILVNMERSRWLPVKLEGDYVAVNIPEFKLHVYHDDSLLWSCNAVVGQTVHPTSLFYGEIKYVVFSPYWNIPPGILRNEIIPGMKRNPSYIKNHNMEITGYKDGLPIVRQKPGPSNSLGLVKFLFPNSYNIYLHDTPSKSLFNETARAFSHGCIRIEEPAKLAAYLLKDMDEWNPEKIESAMHAGSERYVTLSNKVPVFISYFTAFIDRDSRLNFRKDVYDLDERLASMIISGEGVY